MTNSWIVSTFWLPYKSYSPLEGPSLAIRGLNLSTNYWRITFWSLFFVWTLDAILVVSHVRAGILTNHGADLTLPAWLYILIRSLDNPRRQTILRRFLGRTPELAAGAIFVASTLTEISQYFWPKGIFPGTFDLLDILAYAAGIGTCYLIDRRGN